MIQTYDSCILMFGGEGGIRTPVGGKAEAVFKTAAIDHSATSPACRTGSFKPPLLDGQSDRPLPAGFFPEIHFSINTCIHSLVLAGPQGPQPPTDGFGDRYSTN